MPTFASAKLPRELGGPDPGGGGAVLQRGCVVVQFDQFGERPPDVLQQGGDVPYAIGSDVTGDAAGQHGIHHQPMAEACIGRP